MAVAAGTGLCAGAPGVGWGACLLVGLVLSVVLVGRWLGLVRPWSLALVAALAFLRGSAPEESDPTEPPPASVRDLDEGARLGLRPRLARWCAEGAEGQLEWSGGVRWRASVAAAGRQAPLGDGQLLGPGAELARAGERVLVLPGTPPRLRSEGRVPGPWSRAGILGSLIVEPDALVRLVPAPRTLVSRGFEALGAQLGLDPGANRWRRALLRAASRIESAAGPALPRGLLGALLFGARDGLDHEIKDLFTRTGTRHLLAISGLHVGLLVVLILLPVTRLFGRTLQWPLLILALVSFVPLAGASPPVVRAAVVLGLGLGAGRVGRFGRRISALNLWGAALLLELVPATRPLESLSLRLSYLATLGLVLGLAPISKVLGAGIQRGLERLPGAEGWRPAWARARWTAPLIALQRVASVTIAASLAAVLFTLPITWSTFGELSPIGIVLTPLCVPLLAWILTLGWPLALVVALTSACGGKASSELLVRFAGWALAPAGTLMARLFHWADGLPGTPVALPPRPEVWLWLPLLSLVAAQLLARRDQGPEGGALRRTRRWLEALGLAAAGGLLLPWSPAPPAAELIVLDVGHGTACLLHTESGAVWLFDGGTRDRVGLWREALGPQLAAWDGPAPSVILSHGDQDHWSGLVDLVERRPPALWVGHVTPELAARLPPGTPRLDLEAGSLPLPAGVTQLKLLRAGPLKGNEGSRMLVLDTPFERVLVTGDAENDGLAAQLRNPLLDRADPVAVLLLPHHGSDSSQIGALLEATHPQRLWISNGAPAQLDAELARRGIQPEETRLLGPLCWTGKERETLPAGVPNMGAQQPGPPHDDPAANRRNP